MTQRCIASAPLANFEFSSVGMIAPMARDFRDARARAAPFGVSAELAGRRLYLPLQRLADHARAREGAGDGSARHADGPGNIGDPHLL